MAVAQSNIGVQLFYWDITSSKFKYLLPTTGDLPAMGGAPATIEVTENDSPTKQYISDRADNPALELSYNYLAEYEVKIKGILSPVKSAVFSILLPLGTAFVLECTGDTWLNGGSPIQGSLSLIQSKEKTLISDITDVFTTDQVSQLAELGITVTTTEKMTDKIDWTSVPAGKINQGL